MDESYRCISEHRSRPGAEDLVDGYGLSPLVRSESNAGATLKLQHVYNSPISGPSPAELAHVSTVPDQMGAKSCPEAVLHGFGGFAKNGALVRHYAIGSSRAALSAGQAGSRTG